MLVLALAVLGSAQQPPDPRQLPPDPTQCCITNRNLTEPTPGDPSRPLGFTPFASPGAAAASQFEWMQPADSELRALRIAGGVGRWTTRLVLPSDAAVTAAGSSAAGAAAAAAAAAETLSVGFSFRAANISVRARPRYGGCARLTGVLSVDPPGAQAPSKTSNATHLVAQRILCYGQAARRGQWLDLQLGDFALPSPQPSHLFLSVWLADLAPLIGVPPAVVWVRGFSATLAPSPPPPSGMGRLLASGGAPGGDTWTLWSEHANHKVYADSPAPHCGGAGAAAGAGAGGGAGGVQMRAAAGERASVQLALLSGGLWGRWRWSGWQATRSSSGAGAAGRAALAAPAAQQPEVSIQQVGFVNITGGTAPYGRVGVTPDPLTSLELATSESTGDVFLHCRYNPPLF